MELKIAFLIILASASNVLATPGYSQEARVSLDMENTKLEQVLDEIERQSEFYFIFNQKQIEVNRVVDIHVKNKMINDILPDLFKGTNVNYAVFDRKILLTSDPVNSNSKVINSKTEYQQKVITGKVIGSNGETLPGVNITLKGTLIGVSTDLEGRYSIEVPDGNGILVFSFIGYTTQEIAINGSTTIDVKLQEESKGLSEVVVTALGIKKEAKSLTYDTQTIGSNKLSAAKEVNVLNSLKGQIAGMTITNVGDGISSSPKVLLRGSRSINGNNEPLYITNGVPSNMGLLDPNNIETITVLKGASAAAIYGSAGQNGAIIITTKNAIPGKFVVTYNGGITLNQALVLSDFQYEYGQGDQGIFYANSEDSWGPKADGQMVTLWNGNTVPLLGQKNRFKEFYQIGQTLNNSISISGGSDKMQTYLSYANNHAKGVLRNNNNLMRNTIDLKIRNNISSKFTVDANVTYSNENVAVSSQYPYSSIYVTPISIPLSEMKDYRYVDINGITRQNYWKPNSLGSNPYFTMNGDLSNSLQNRISGLFSAKYKFSDVVDFLIRASLSKTSWETELKKYAGISTVQNVWGSDYYKTNIFGQQTYVDALFSFKHNLAKNFTLSGNVGASIQDGKNEGNSFHANGLNKEDFFYTGNAKAAVTSNTYSRSPQVQGIYALTTIAYKNYLYMDLTARNDWSSALPKNHESYFYPSVGLTAVLSDILKLPSWVTFGKARASFAKSGYGGVQYLNHNYYSVGFGGLIVTPTIQSLGNYKPELTSSLEAGLEWRFLNNRLGFNLTYYKTETKNQLLLIGAPAASLFDQRYINAGLIRNNGVELVLNMNPVKTKDFSWDVVFNFAKNKNKVIKLTDEIKSVIISGGGSSAAIIKVVEGNSYGDIYVKGWQRDSLGRKLVNDIGSPLLTGGQDINVGNYNPNYLIGFSNSFTYKNILLSFLIDYRNGGRVISASQALLDGRGVSKETISSRESGLILDAYTVDGKKNDKSISAQSYYSLVGDIYLAGEFYNYSATNMRLRELVLTYSVSNKIFKNGFIRDVKLSIVGSNLFYFQRSAPFDPDISSVGGNSGGQEFGYIPSTRNLGFNIKLLF